MTEAPVMVVNTSVISKDEAEKQETFKRTRDPDGEKAVRDKGADLKAKGEIFSDPEFPADDKSLFVNPANKKYLPDTVKWMRPADFLGHSNFNMFDMSGDKPNLNADDFVQGKVGDCYFLAAISACALRPSLILDLIIENFLEQGIIGVKFFREGEWKTVVVDDLLPCIEESEGKWVPVFAHPKKEDPFELWGCYMEKAWAKLHGSYEIIQNGSIADTQVYLTAGLKREFNFTSDETWRMHQSGALWKLLMMASIEQNDKSKQEASFLSASGIQGEEIPAVAGQTDGVEEEDLGLVEDHGYSILRCQEELDYKLVNVCNPWGCFVWKGDFAENDKRWTSKLKARVNYETCRQVKGSFWMSLEDVCSKFAFISLLETPEPHWFRARQGGEWKAGSTAGGRGISELIQYNPCYHLEMTSEVLKIQIEVEERRSKDARFKDYPAVEVYVCPIKDGKYDFAEASYAFCSQQRVKTGHTKLDPKKGPYALFVFNWRAGEEGKFWLTFYSEEALSVERMAPPSPTPEHAQLMATASYPNTCTKCKEAVDTTKPFRSNWGSVWHPSCWECAMCDRPFGRGTTQVYHIGTVDGKEGGFCKGCYKSSFFPKCAHCEKAIVPGEDFTGDSKVAEDGKCVHMECWDDYLYSQAEKCAVCQGSLITIDKRAPMSVHDVGEDKKVHAACLDQWMNESTDDKCAHCNKSIVLTEGQLSGGAVVSGGKKVHQECYPQWADRNKSKCEECSEDLVDPSGQRVALKISETSGLHKDCLPAYLKKTAKHKCAKCGEGIAKIPGEFSGLYETKGSGDDAVRTHVECLDATKEE